MGNRERKTLTNMEEASRRTVTQIRTQFTQNVEMLRPHRSFCHR